MKVIVFLLLKELTEESLPFLILFHKPDDMESVRTFEKEVKRQLLHLKRKLNFCCAPLHSRYFSNFIHSSIQSLSLLFNPSLINSTFLQLIES